MAADTEPTTDATAGPAVCIDLSDTARHGDATCRRQITGIKRLRYEIT